MVRNSRRDWGCGCMIVGLISAFNASPHLVCLSDDITVEDAAACSATVAAISG